MGKKNKNINKSKGQNNPLQPAGQSEAVKKPVSERYFSESIIQTSPTYFVAIDAEGKTKVMNQTMLKALGYSSEEAIGTDYIKTFIPKRDRRMLYEVFAKLINLNKPTINENSILTKDGRELLAEWHGQPVYDANGRFDFFFGIGIDITKKKQAQEEVKKFKTISDRANYGTAIADLDGNIIYINECFASMHGLTIEEAIGKHLSIFHTDDQMPDVNRLNEKLIKKGLYPATEVWHKRKNGSVFPTMMNATIIKDENNKPLYISASAIDITVRKRSVLALEESEAKFRGLVETSSDWIWEVNAEGVYTYASPQVEAILGYKPEEVIGKTPFDLMPPEEAEQIAGVFGELIKAGQPIVALENINLRKDGQRVVLETSGVPFVDGTGTVIGYRGVDRNITERKQAEESLHESEDKLLEAQRIAQLGHYVLDIKTGLWTSSAELNNIFGIDEDYKKDIAGWLNIVHPDYKEIMASYFQDDVLSQRQKFDKEYKIVSTISGQEKWVHGLGSLKCDENDNPIEMFGTIQDITKHKQADEALGESEKKYKHLFDKMIDGFALHEIICNNSGKPIDYRFLDINPSFERLTGLKASDIIGKRVLSIIPDLEPIWIKNYGSVALTGKPIHFEEYNAQLKKHFEITAYRPAERQFACIFIDITDRRKAEEALRERERILDALINAPTESAILTDSKGAVLAINRIGTERIGKKEDEIIGMEIYDYLPPKIAKSRRAKGNQVVRTGKPVRFQDERENRYFDNNIYPVFDDKGKVSALAIYARDVTRHRQAEIMMRSLFEGTAKATGKDFFDKLVLHLATALNCKYAIIGLLDNSSPKKITTISYWNKNRIGKNFFFEITGTPCEKVDKRNVCFYRSGVSKEYPKDKWLSKNKIEAYLGVPILNPSGGPIGILVVMDTREFSDDLIDGAHSLMAIFASRAAAELERISAEDDQRAIADRLRDEQKALFHKNVALKQILEHMETEKSDFKHQISSSMEQALMPFVNKLRIKGGVLTEKDLELFEDAIKSITGTKIDDFKANYSKLTSREMDICDLIREAKSSQEIADMLHLSLQTIQKHRSSIRKKLQLKNKDINLPAYLRYK